ncbi:MAG TPA: hypothetical protein PLD51_00795 [Pontiellaceae bacterium]|nr:hypothetical protein [Pontiellaceae bacterium]HPR82369.1 hypothetical protein [Pontiellaceae bacterium]
MKAAKENQGFVLTGVLMLLLVAALVGGAFLFSARNSFATVDQWRLRDECLFGLQSGLERREYELDQIVRTNNVHDINMFDGLANQSASKTILWTNFYSISPHVVTTLVVTTSGSVIKNLSNDTATITLTNIATASRQEGSVKITRKVREVVEYYYAAAPVLGGDGSVFDNVFFIDNVGLFSGVNADFNGDVYANKDLDLQYSSLKVNGDRYTGGNILDKHEYKCDSWSGYGNNRARPAENTDYNRSNTNTYWPQGYDDNVQSYEMAEKKEMPFIGPLSEYEAYAAANTGFVTQVYAVTSTGGLSNRNTSVAAVWGDGAGENSGIGANDNGCLILIGTSNNPIRISGVVVARGDIYIKGYYTGAGTLYAGRNIYVLDNLIALNPPTWPHPDSNPEATANSNKTKDFLGLCAKGSMAFGDPGALDVNFLNTPYTGSHATDASDAELGYVSYYAGGVPYFNGNYTVPDGNGSMQRSDGSVRHFYDPMISSTAMSALSPVARLSWIDAVLYANHLIAGDFQNASLNGAFICRDESVARYGDLTLNWDIRLGSRSKDNLGFSPWLAGMLTRQGDVRKIKWTELAP